MPELTDKQKDWLDRKFLEYFPHVFLSHSTELFLKYTRFAENGPLSLPSHLKLLNDNGVAEIEFDIPQLLGDDAFRRLINRNHLADLQIEAEIRTFDIHEFLIRKDFEAQIRAEDSQFLHQFCLVCPGRTYTEDVPDLFIKIISTAYDEYDPIKGTYQINYAGISLHKQSSIIEAYRRFAHKIYTLRRFGMWRETTIQGYISPSDYEKLNEHFFEYLEQIIPFYENILQQNKKYFSKEKTSDPEIFYEERNKGILRVAFAEMIYNVLETVSNRGNIRVPTAPNVLIRNITRQSNKKWLFKQNKKADLPGFKEGDETIIRKIFNDISVYLSSPFLSKKTKAILESANAPKGKGDPYEQLWALYEELLCNPDNQNFLNMPTIQNIFTEGVRRKLSSLYWQQYISSMDAPLSFDSNGNEITLHSSQNKSVLKVDGQMPIKDEVITKETLGDILAYIKTQFTDEADAEFIKILMIDVKTQIDRMKSLKPSDNERILTNEFTPYVIGGTNNPRPLFDQYIHLRSPTSAPCLTKGEFTEKIINVSHYIQEKLNEQLGGK